MWNRPALLLWISVRIRNGPGKRGFALWLPVPLFLLGGLADMTEDVFLALRLFPGVRRRLRDFPDPAALLRAVSDSLRDAGPADLADIDVEKDGRRVAVKCLLR